ncbi:MAG: hypothetical protein NNA20_11450 [Nitrospira sp.]|nr:hypothetical protein [Nitrospira sp.]
MDQGQRIGLLEVIQYILAIVLVVAAVDWNQYLVLPLVASVVAMPYAIWRKIQSIERGSSSLQQAQAQMSPLKQEGVPQGPLAGQSAVSQTGIERNGKPPRPELSIRQAELTQSSRSRSHQSSPMPKGAPSSAWPELFNGKRLGQTGSSEQRQGLDAETYGSRSHAHEAKQWQTQGKQ